MTQLATQMRHRDREMVPRILVQAMFTLMLASLVLVSVAVLTDRPHVGVVTDSPVTAQVTVTLDGRREGGVAVRDAAGRLLALSSEPGNGFIDVIWRVLARDRLLAGAPADAPFEVIRRENGRVSVLDPATGRSVELTGHGPDNVAAFARLIDG